MTNSRPGATARRGGIDDVGDDDLTRRVAVALAVVVAANLVVVLGVVALVEPWLAPVGAGVAAAFGVSVPPVVGRVVLVVAGVALAVAGQARYARLEALGEAGVDAGADPPPAVVDRVTRLAAGMDVAPPRVAVADAAIPNSFVVDGVGDPTLVVSTGLLDAVDGAELDAVVAHELAHVKNRDAFVLTVAAFLPALVGDGYSIRRDLLPFGRAGGTALLVAAVAVLVAGAAAVPGVGVVTAAAAVGFSLLLGAVGLGVVTAPVVVVARRLSRAREFIADRAGGLAAGDPLAMATALTALDGRATSTPDADLRDAASPASTGRTVRALCLLPHGFGPSDRDDGPLAVRAHPPTAERVDRLKRLAAAVETGRSRSG